MKPIQYDPDRSMQEQEPELLAYLEKYIYD